VALLALAAVPSVASAEDFDWGPTFNISSLGYTITGLNFTSPVTDQGKWGTCWDFAATAALEANYKITRNDTAYSIDLSEQQVPMAFKNYGGGGNASAAMSYQVSNGIVQETELPYHPYSHFKSPSSEWPLHSGWQDRAVIPTSYTRVTATTANMKAMLKAYGPMTVGINGDGYDFYWPGGSVPNNSGSTNHEVLLVGYHDATSADPTGIKSLGGYWIIKNSWSTGWGSYGGYGFVPYTYIEGRNDVYALNGQAYYTGAMATATWNGGSGAWAAGMQTWTTTAGSYAWENKETQAVFNASGTSNAITIGGTAIAHGLTINTGAVGYTFSAGALTVTDSGIVANESVVINCPVTVGAPQTWTTAAGKTLTVNNNVHTVISTLTVDGAGNTYIGGVIDGGGVINNLGVAPGNLVKNGAGTLTIAGPSSYASTISLNAGTLNLAPAAELTAVYSGNISGSGSLTMTGTGTVVLSGTNSYIGLTTVTAGTLQLGANAQALVLTLAGGADIQGGKIALEYLGGAPDVLTPLTASYNGGLWNTGQFKSTTADASHGLGWIDDTGSSQMKVAYTFYGDATLDGKVDASDLAKVLANYNQLSGMVWDQGDFDYNATVDANDLAKVLANYNQGPIVPGIDATSYGRLDAQAIQILTAAGFSVVPEPSTLVLLAAGLLGLLCYAWRRRRLTPTVRTTGGSRNTRSFVSGDRTARLSAFLSPSFSMEVKTAQARPGRLRSSGRASTAG